MTAAIWPPGETHTMRQLCADCLTLLSSILDDAMTTCHFQWVITDTVSEAHFILFAVCRACNCLLVCVLKFCAFVSKMAATIDPIGDLCATCCSSATALAALETALLVAPLTMHVERLPPLAGLTETRFCRKSRLHAVLLDDFPKLHQIAWRGGMRTSNFVSPTGNKADCNTRSTNKHHCC